MRLGAILQADLSDQVREVIRREKSRHRKTSKQWREDNPIHWSGLTRSAGANQYAMRRTQTPKWANRAKINNIYIKAARMRSKRKLPFHVDHIVPLRGQNVSGLHVHYNLRIIPSWENIRKGNRYSDEKYSKIQPTHAC